MAANPATIEQLKSVITQLYDAANSLRAACESQGIRVSQFFYGLEKYPFLSESYGRAQEARAELLADEIIGISDTENDSQRARNRIDARKWAASKMKPGKFGERIDVNMSHTVDIGKALSDARSRVPLPMSYPEHGKSHEPIDITDQTKVLQSDIGSDTLDSDGPKEMTEAEIFS